MRMARVIHRTTSTGNEGETVSFDLSFRPVDRTGPGAEIFADVFLPYGALGSQERDLETLAREQLLSYLKLVVSELEGSEQH